MISSLSRIITASLATMDAVKTELLISFPSGGAHHCVPLGDRASSRRAIWGGQPFQPAARFATYSSIDAVDGSKALVEPPFTGVIGAAALVALVEGLDRLSS